MHSPSQSCCSLTSPSCPQLLLQRVLAEHDKGIACNHVPAAIVLPADSLQSHETYADEWHEGPSLAEGHKGPTRTLKQGG